MTYGFQHMFNILELFVPKALIVKPIVQQAGNNVLKIFHWFGTIFLCASIYPNDII